VRKRALVIAIAAALSVAPAAAANTILDVPGTATLSDVACQTHRTCEAVGPASVYPHAARFVAIHVGTVDTGPSVGASHPIAGVTSPTGIACPTSSICEVVGFDVDGNSVIVPVDLATNTAGTPVSLPGWDEAFALACPAATSCELVGYGGAPSGFAGLVAPVSIAADGTPTIGTTTPDSDVAAFYDVACPSSSTCWAVGPAVGGGAVVLIDPTVDEIGPAMLARKTTGLAGIDCIDADHCTAVGYGGPDGAEGVVVSIVAPASVGAGAPDSAVDEEIGRASCRERV